MKFSGVASGSTVPVRAGALPSAITAALLMGLVPLGAVAADPLSNLPFNLAGGAPNIDIRLRYENVEQDNFVEDANALTVRARLGYTSGKWNNIDGQLEFEGLTDFGDNDNYNSTRNGNTTYPVIADPKFNEINQAWVRWSGLPGTTLKFGRQRIIFDNARWIGNVGWRQNEQTYDATLLTSTFIPKTTVNYAYVTNVNSFRPFPLVGITPPRNLTDDLDIAAHLVNVAYVAIDKKLTLTAYGYFLDFEEIPAPQIARRDTQTLGLRATGTLPVSSLKFSYALEYADQQGYDHEPETVEADYSLVEVALAKDKLKGTLGYELLSGDGTYSLQAPLATAHAHQGWADQFLVTPATGLERIYVSLAATVAKVSLLAIYHDFSPDEKTATVQDYGSEIDLQASYPVIDSFVVTAKYASYSADDFPSAGTPAKTFDTDKYWLFAEYKF